MALPTSSRPIGIQLVVDRRLDDPVRTRGVVEAAAEPSGLQRGQLSATRVAAARSSGGGRCASRNVIDLRFETSGGVVDGAVESRLLPVQVGRDRA